MLAIFRMVELSGGSINIDGIDLSTIPRQEIRERITGVAQDPFLIKGSVRLNADPNGTATDDQITNALRSVHLLSIVQEKGGLDMDIEEIHLSQGQKQLFCLARAMLRHSSILILDEATSKYVNPPPFVSIINANPINSVDSKTDEIMQRVIREKFSNHTILAVAHKLDTILDFDKVAMLEAGELIEFDDPYTLLSTDSAFNRLYTYSMADEDEKDGGMDDIEVIVRDISSRTTATTSTATQSNRASSENGRGLNHYTYP